MSLDPTPLASTKRPAWKFWGTLGWSLGLLAVMATVGLLMVLVLAGIYGVDPWSDAPSLIARFSPAWLSCLQSIALLAPLCLMIGFAARCRGWQFSDYVALRRPSRRHAVTGMAAAIALVVLTDGSATIMHLPVASSFLVNGIKRDPTLATLALMATSLVVTTPLGEELVFRGFIYRGFAASRLGPALAVVLSSVMFTAMHVQYDAIGLTEVLVDGLLLGTMRAVSGSTLLTIAMHALVNAVAFIEAVLSSGILDRAG